MLLCAAQIRQAQMSARLRCGKEAFGESYDYGVDNATVKAPKNVRVVIDNVRGNTKVTTADIDEVRLSGRKTVRAKSREEANKADRQTKVEISAAGEILTVRGNQGRAENRRISTDIEIVAPNGAGATATSRLQTLAET